MSDLAKRLIAENKRTKAKFLDLGNCGISAIPAEVSDLVWISSLSLSEFWLDRIAGVQRIAHSVNKGDPNRVTDLRPLTFLPHLQTLDLRGTRVTDLTPLAKLAGLEVLNLAGTPVAALAPLAQLPGLRALYLAGTHVTDLSPLAELAGLQILNLRLTQVAALAPLAQLAGLRALYLGGTQVTDLTPLAELAGLQTLDLESTEVTDLTPLAKLVGLQTLDLGGTQVTDLAPLAHLAGLLTLNLSYTQVTDLSPLEPLIRQGLQVLWSSEPWKAPGIYVEDCPLTNPPPEITKLGNEAILDYFDALKSGQIDHLYEAKMLILGEGGAGKTSLLRRLYQPDQPLPTEDETTKGIAIYRHEFPLKNGRTFRLNVWDFGSQEIYHAIHQFFFTHRSLYLLVDDTRKDHKSVSHEGFKYWLDLVDVFGGHSPVLIFQNEKGGRSKAIDLAGIKGQYDNVKERYSGDLQHPHSATRLSEGIEHFASHLSHIGEELPAEWIQIRKEIELRAAQTPHITQQEYFDIYANHLQPDRTKALFLSRYLHDLGVFLHFRDDGLLSRIVILQNSWATEAVFRILDDETVKGHHGRFAEADCHRLWEDSTYAGMHPELLALMKRFELCYELRDSTPATWLAPKLLPPAKPTGLINWGNPNDLVLRYCYKFLPKGHISRLTVRQHRFVLRPDLGWVTGALFQRDGAEVLVELLPNGNEIELRARGPQRKDLLSVIADDLDALNGSYPGLKDKIKKLIPCNCTACSVSSSPRFFEEGDLLWRKKHDRLEVECPEKFEQVSVLKLLDGVNFDRLPAWGKEDTIRIFLASSAELKDDRDDFELYVLQQNHTFRQRGIYFEVIRWENFLDAMSRTRLQDEYNKAIKSCDLVISLFFTKTGKFTEEEFDEALQQFKATGKPQIFTYFKNADIKAGDITSEILTLLNFKEKLAKLGHFPTTYNNTEHLKQHFRDQLDRLYPVS